MDRLMQFEGGDTIAWDQNAVDASQILVRLRMVASSLILILPKPHRAMKRSKPSYA